MPRIDISAIALHTGTGYPEPLKAMVKGRQRKPLGDAGGLTQFGVNLTRLKPGAASAHRHWHEREDELVYVLEGQLVLVEEDSETLLGPGDAAAFKAGVANGHHLVNRSQRDAVLLEIGTRSTDERCHYSDVDLAFVSDDAGNHYTRKSGEPY